MTLANMEYFIVIAQEKSFTKAAQQLHITQQSLSANIASLEDELGCQLFIRRVPLELTYAGTIFLRYASEFKQNIHTMKQEFCDITQNQKGILRIGIAHTRGRIIMPNLIDKFQQKYPNISIELSESSNEHIYNTLLNGEIDIAIANFPTTIKGIEVHNFFEEEVKLFISYELLYKLYGNNLENFLNKIDSGNFSPLQECPFVMGHVSDISAKIGISILKDANIQPQIKVTSDNIETLLALCLKGVGACFCPKNLAYSTLSTDQIHRLKELSLGNKAKYDIRFGYLKQSYQWSIISEFINIALKHK